jgi:hypothetical protein
MGDEKQFTELLDRYLHCKDQCSLAVERNNGDENTEFDIWKMEYSDARKALNKYMSFMRIRVHSHPDIGLDHVEGN